MTLYYEVKNKHITVSGKTYHFRDAIKSLGGRFEGQSKTWQLPCSDENLKKIDLLCQEQGGGPLESNIGVPIDVQSKSGAILIPETEKSISVPTEISDSEAVPEPGALSKVTSYTVLQLMDIIEGVIKNSFPSAVWVEGELQNVQIRANAVFFELGESKDDHKSQNVVTVKGIMWKSTYKSLVMQYGEQKVKDILQNDLKVRCACQVHLYKGRGQISLTVVNLDFDFTKGALALAREKLLKELRTKGLDQMNKRVLLPRMPFHVGLISAAGSRAESDFLDQLSELKFPGHVTFISCPMQGSEVPKKVTQAITQLEKEKCDVIVLTRGGGSAADLRWFDAPEIAYKIAESKIPIVAAIGHHDDYCVAEEISFLRQKTPTAAADFVAGKFAEVQIQIARYGVELRRLLSQSYEKARSNQSLLFRELQNATERSLYNRQKQLIYLQQEVFNSVARKNITFDAYLDRLKSNLFQKAEGVHNRLNHHFQSLEKNFREQAINQFFDRKTNQMVYLEQQLKIKDPRPWMKLGWTRLFHEEQQIVVQSIDILKENDIISAKLLDGKLLLTVDKITAE